MSDFPKAAADLSFDQQQQKLIDDLNGMGDILSQYTYLLEVSASSRPMSDGEKERAAMVDKCQSQVWISCTVDDCGAVWFCADSDTLIIRGVLYLMMQLVNGRPASDFPSYTFDFVGKTELVYAFSDERLNGFAAIQKKMAELCSASLKEGVVDGD